MSDEKIKMLLLKLQKAQNNVHFIMLELKRLNVDPSMYQYENVEPAKSDVKNKNHDLLLQKLYIASSDSGSDTYSSSQESSDNDSGSDTDDSMPELICL